MSEGIYYIMGGVAKGARIKETIMFLAGQFQTPANILYIGAAHDNDPSLERGFSNSLLVECDNGQLKLSSLTFQTSKNPNCVKISKGDIEQKFSDADIIFFDGGEIETLKSIFDKFKLKKLCQEAFNRGASVGGLCAGGSFFGSTVIHSGIEDESLRTDRGLGLIERTTITCYIGDKAQAHRLSMLENTAYQANEIGLGVPIDQTVTWNRKQGFQKAFPNTIGPVIYTL